MASRSRPRKGTAARRLRHFRPFVEPLEERWLPSMTFTVNTTGDSPLVIFNPNGTTLTSLRAAINQVNGDTNDSAASPDTIAFNIPQPASGPVVQTINVGATGNGPLPTITRPVIIDGITEPGHAPGFSFNPLIELNGANAGPGANGLWITGGSSGVRELAINRFQAAGIRLDGGGMNHSGGNLIGTDPTGLTAEGNGEGVLVTNGSSGNIIGFGASDFIAGNIGDGVEITGTNTNGNTVAGNIIGLGLASPFNPVPNQGDGVVVSSGAQNNRIGSNIIAANGGNGIVLNTGATGNLVQDNAIGTTFSSSLGLGNGNDGILVENGASGNTIGGLIRAGNVISGNGNAGVFIIQASGNFVQGNFIGTDVTGKVALPNDPSGTLLDGVDLLDGATNNTIGGASSRDANGNLSGLGNLISGNGFDGVFIADYFGGGAATGNMVQGNFIGTDVTGTHKLPNQGNGVHLEGGAIGNTIGGTDPSLRNVISGNGDNAALAHTPFGVVGAGVQVADFFGYGPVHDNQIVGNYIGTDATGTQGVGSSNVGNLFDGVILQQGVFNNTVGPGNVISGNGAHGVALLGTTTASALPVGGPSSGSLTLTPAGQAAGFTFSTFATGFPPRSSDNAGPLGIVVPASGGVLVGDTLGNVRLFPTDTDGQNAASFPPAPGASYGTQVSGLARLGSTLYVAIPAKNQVAQIKHDGTIKHVVANIPNANGITADPLTGHLFVSAAFSSAIFEVDPIAGTAPVFAHVEADGLAFDPTTNTLYAAGYGDPVYDRHIVGFNASTGAPVFDSGVVPGQPDGIAVGTGVLAGSVFVNTNAGTLVEVNLATHAQTVLASGGSRGDFVAPDPTNGTLLVTQSTLIARLIPPAGGGFQSAINTTGNVVQGDYIGTDYTGTQRLTNNRSGVIIEGGASGNRIGGPGEGNVISANGYSGIAIQDPTTANNVVESNLIGTDAAGTGTHALGNVISGVYLQLGAHDNRIGTDGDGINDPLERNVISGNYNDGVTIDRANNNVVAGDYLGTDAAGRTAVPNTHSGVYVYRSQGNRIGAQGGDADGAGERNVISGNGQAGVAIDGLDARNNTVASNFIGTNADGQAQLPNGVGVHLVNGANGNTIGGSDPGLGNVISGNTGDGLDIQGNGRPAGAVADYRAEGDATDALGFHPGTIQGNVTFEPGRFGQAFHFDGTTGQSVNIPASPSLNVGAGAGLTLTAWINPDDVSSQEPIVEWTNGVHLWFSTTFGGAQGPGNLYANIEDTAGNAHIISSAPGLIQPHQWQFVALTYDQGSGVATLYGSDGIVRQQTLGSFTPNTTGDVNLGHRVPQSFSGSGQFAGGLDEVGIYNRGLTASLPGESSLEIQNLHLTNGVGRNDVFGNRIGTALDPGIKLANGGDGVSVQDSAFNFIGDFHTNVPVNTAEIFPAGGAANVIAGNMGRGVSITGSASENNYLAGDSIGTDVTGTVKQGNGRDGVYIAQGATFNHVGMSFGLGFAGNLIAYNRGHGVVVGNGLNDPSYANDLEGNRGIFGNALIGIDLGNDGVTPNTTPAFLADANDLANFPVITSAQAAGGVTIIRATVHGLPNSSLLSVEFYADSSPDPTGYGQGETRLGQLSLVQLDGSGNAAVTETVPVNLTGKYVTAIATDFSASTSEFAQDAAVTPLVPTLTGLSPSATTEGPMTLTVNGTDFVNGAVVSVNGTPLATTFVSGTHLTAAVPAGLLEEGTASVTAANPAPGGGTSNALSLTVADAPLTVTGSAITATGSAPFSGVVATFGDAGGSEPAGSYTVLIGWGDGSSSPGTFVPTSTGFQVVGSHTYTSASVGSPYTTTVTVTDEGGSTASGSGNATVAHAPLTAWGQNVALTEGASGPAVVALIRDPDPRDAGSDFTVTINWGDNTSSAGTVSPAADGLLQVTGAHAYAEEGNRSVTVSIQDGRGGSAVATAGAAVADAPLTAFPVTLTVTGNKNFAGIVGLFRDADPAAAAGLYTATITWDDGTTSAGTVSGSGTFLVTAAHRFGKFKGPHTILITVTDAGGASVTFTDTIIDPRGHHARHHGGRHHRPPGGTGQGG